MSWNTNANQLTVECWFKIACLASGAITELEAVVGDLRGIVAFVEKEEGVEK